ncbi:MAG: hypothetical protein AABZ44_05315, partial [Elusimicrobiota bacterium]
MTGVTSLVSRIKDTGLKAVKKIDSIPPKAKAAVIALAVGAGTLLAPAIAQAATVQYNHADSSSIWYLGLLALLPAIAKITTVDDGASQTATHSDQEKIKDADIPEDMIFTVNNWREITLSIYAGYYEPFSRNKSSHKKAFNFQTYFSAMPQKDHLNALRIIKTAFDSYSQLDKRIKSDESVINTWFYSLRMYAQHVLDDLHATAYRYEDSSLFEIEKLEREIEEIYTYPGVPNSLEMETAIALVSEDISRLKETIKSRESKEDQRKQEESQRIVEAAQYRSAMTPDAMTIETAVEVITDFRAFKDNHAKIEESALGNPYRESAQHRGMTRDDVLAQAVVTAHDFIVNRPADEKTSKVLQNLPFREAYQALCESSNDVILKESVKRADQYISVWQLPLHLTFTKWSAIASIVASISGVILFTISAWDPRSFSTSDSSALFVASGVSAWIIFALISMGIVHRLSSINKIPLIVEMDRIAVKKRSNKRHEQRERKLKQQADARAPELLKKLSPEKKVKAAKLRVDPSVIPSVLPVILSEAKDQSSDSSIDSSLSLGMTEEETETEEKIQAEFDAKLARAQAKYGERGVAILAPVAVWTAATLGVPALTSLTPSFSDSLLALSALVALPLLGMALIAGDKTKKVFVDYGLLAERTELAIIARKEQVEIMHLDLRRDGSPFIVMPAQLYTQLNREYTSMEFFAEHTTGELIALKYMGTDIQKRAILAVTVGSARKALQTLDLLTDLHDLSSKQIGLRYGRLLKSNISLVSAKDAVHPYLYNETDTTGEIEIAPTSATDLTHMAPRRGWIPWRVSIVDIIKKVTIFVGGAVIVVIPSVANAINSRNTLHDFGESRIASLYHDGSSAIEAVLVASVIFLPFALGSRYLRSLRNSAGVNIRMPRYGSRQSKSLSPVTTQSALPSSAHSSTALSLASRQSETFSDGLTNFTFASRNPPTSSMSKADSSNLGSASTDSSSLARSSDEIAAMRPLSTALSILRQFLLPVKALTKTLASRTATVMVCLPGSLNDLFDLFARQMLTADSAAQFSRNPHQALPAESSSFLVKPADQMKLVSQGQSLDDPFSLRETLSGNGSMAVHHHVNYNSKALEFEATPSKKSSDGPAMTITGRGIDQEQHERIINPIIAEAFTEDRVKHITRDDLKYQFFDPEGDYRENGTEIFLIETSPGEIKQLAKRVGLRSPHDIVAHAGRDRNRVYYFAHHVFTLEQFTPPQRAEIAKHELLHLKQPLLSEASVMSMAPLPVLGLWKRFKSMINFYIADYTVNAQTRRWFWAHMGQMVLTLTGISFYVTALPFFVLAATDGDKAVVSYARSAHWAAMLIFSLFSGLIVDRLATEKSIYLPNIARAGIVIAIPILYIVFGFWSVPVFLGLVAAQTIFHNINVVGLQKADRLFIKYMSMGNGHVRNHLITGKSMIQRFAWIFGAMLSGLGIGYGSDYFGDKAKGAGIAGYGSYAIFLVVAASLAAMFMKVPSASSVEWKPKSPLEISASDSQQSNVASDAQRAKQDSTPDTMKTDVSRWSKLKDKFNEVGKG